VRFLLPKLPLPGPAAMALAGQQSGVAAAVGEVLPDAAPGPSEAAAWVLRLQACPMLAVGVAAHAPSVLSDDSLSAKHSAPVPQRACSHASKYWGAPGIHRLADALLLNKQYCRPLSAMTIQQ
jgi:hypothetical protein